MNRPTIVREFGSEAEATLAVATLRANGIDADVRPTGYAVGMTGAFAGPTVVIADSLDVERAKDILDGPAPESA